MVVGSEQMPSVTCPFAAWQREVAECIRGQAGAMGRVQRAGGAAGCAYRDRPSSSRLAPKTTGRVSTARVWLPGSLRFPRLKDVTHPVILS